MILDVNCNIKQHVYEIKGTAYKYPLENLIPIKVFCIEVRDDLCLAYFMPLYWFSDSILFWVIVWFVFV